MPNTSPFSRSGLARKSDLESDAWKTIFAELEQSQEVFLHYAADARSEAYLDRWPGDALHSWSRIWEYPYVLYHVHEFVAAQNSKELSRVLDLGSGVTFFPGVVAATPCALTCMDADATCVRDMQKSVALHPPRGGAVEVCLGRAEQLPFSDASFDCVYTVSVLEHIPEMKGVVREVARILKPGGRFIVTLDLDMHGKMPMSVEQYATFRSEISEWFRFVVPETTVHPLDVLDSARSPFPYQQPTTLQRAWWWITQRVVRPALDRSAKELPPYVHLCVLGVVLERITPSSGGGRP